MTERNREKNKVQQSNSPASNMAMIFLPIGSALPKPIVFSDRNSISSTIFCSN